MTKTYALLRISEATYLELKGKLEAAGYDHKCCLNSDSPGSPILHLDGIAVYPEVEMIGTDEQLEGFPCRAGFAPNLGTR